MAANIKQSFAAHAKQSIIYKSVLLAYNCHAFEEESRTIVANFNLPLLLKEVLDLNLSGAFLSNLKVTVKHMQKSDFVTRS